MAVKTIRVENIGPISELSIPIPESGGVVVLHGKNGAGKTKALAATEALLSGRSGEIAPRRGTVSGVGMIDGFGVRLRVGKRISRSGTELEVLSLDGSVDPASLVDPGIADPVRADAVRIKSLVALTGIQPTMAEYKAAIGSAAVPTSAMPSETLLSDPLAYTAGLKKSCESLAREYETVVQKIGGELDALRAANAGIDLAADCDGKRLAETYEQAVRTCAAAEAQIQAAADARDRAEEARTQLQTLKSKDIQELTDGIAGQKHQIVEAEEREKRLKQELLEIQAYIRTYRVHLSASERALEDAVTFNELLAESARIVDAAETFNCPSTAELAILVQEQERAQRAQVTGALVREAKIRDAKIAEKESHLSEIAADGMRLREAASKVEDVLTAAVRKSGLENIRVDGCRLAVPDGDGRVKPFDELSRGERWRIVIELLAKSCGAGCLVPVSQEAWEGLDQDARKELAQIAQKKQVTLLTAQCDFGPLRAELFE